MSSEPRNPEHSEEPEVKSEASESQEQQETDESVDSSDTTPDAVEASEELSELEVLQQEITALQAQAEENRELALRTKAEAENIRRRAQQDAERARTFAIEKFATELLAVVDSLDSALAQVEPEDVNDAMFKGTELTQKLLLETMGKHGIERLDPVGEKFDPELHEAMVMQPSEEVDAGHVITVFQCGYRLNGRLIRPARVIVAAD